jgi:pimeloyl-ACP methyl ester carboxylesterase
MGKTWAKGMFLWNEYSGWVYLLTGDYDYSATPESTSRLAGLIPGAKVQIMSGLGHFPMMENPDAFRGYLIPILKELSQRLQR